MATQPKSALSRKRAMSAAPPVSADGCVITYYFNGRAFQRLFVESDIEGMKEVVRRKLELAPGTRLSLAQLVDDQRVDLEDEADFSAFKFGTSIKSEMYVEVSISTPPVAQLASPSITSPSLNLEHASAGPSSSRQPPAQSTAAPAKPKRAKKALAAPAIAADTNEFPDKLDHAAGQVKPVSKKDPGPPEALVVPASTVQPKPKKRSRKSEAEDEPAMTTNAPSNADNSAIVDEPPDPAPPKKKRKSKAELADSYGPVAVSLPPPGPARRKSRTAATAEKPASAAPVSVGSNADIIQRWASGSGASTSKSAAPAAPATATANEGTGKPKKKRGKAKETLAQSLAETIQSEPPACVVCLKAHSGSSVPLSCPLLTRRDSDIISFVETRVKDLMASQGPDRANQMAISRLKDWLKQRAQEAEEQNVFAPLNSSTPVPKANPTKPKANSSSNIQLGTGAPRPVVPKKSKLSSVAVSHQSERSSTDDEDIVKSVMQSALESDAETTEEDDASDEEIANPPSDPVPAEPVREATPPPKVSAPAKSVVTPAPPVSSSDPSNLALSRQHMSRSDMFALLDGLEDEEAGETKQDESDGEEDDGGNELAESTPSDVARRRHKKSVRIEADDSDVEPVGREEDEDVEMEEVEDSEGAAENSSQGGAQSFRLSQVLKSSQSLGGDASQQSITLDKGKGKAKQDDEIEEYESDQDGDEDEAVDDAASSPIEPASGPDDRQADGPEETLKSQPAESNRAKHQVKGAEAEVNEPTAGDTEAAAAPPPPKKRGRPPLSQAVKEERAAERARIQAEKEAKRAEKAAEKATAAPKKKGRPSVTKPTESEQGVEGAKETNVNKPRASTSNSNASTVSVELPFPKSHGPSSQAKPDSVDTTTDVVTPKKRGRPPLSQAVIEERKAEKERIKAERAIKKLEARTAKANAKRAKGREQASPESAAEEPEDADKTVDSVVSDEFAEPASPVLDHPEWEVLKPPPSSTKTDSSQTDEIESTLGQHTGTSHINTMRLVVDASLQKPTSVARSMLPKHIATEEPDTEGRSTAKRLTRPLFMPSSGLVKTNSSHPGPLPSSPLVPITTSLSQPTPSARRRSMASADLPRFTNFKKEQELLRQKRRASHMPTSQPLTAEKQASRPNGSQEFLEIDESSSDENSSADEGANKTVTPSNKKRRSVLGYFSQA
ncbi:hypothetical protein FRC06_003180 [Ceratobasidium sp. 370]|nr:hypothetical protein FRC06_003180 [Ceratobasidium sp. 370]